MKQDKLIQCKTRENNIRQYKHIGHNIRHDVYKTTFKQTTRQNKTIQVKPMHYNIRQYTATLEQIRQHKTLQSKATHG